jgi:ABC-type sulfate/molybdate transport systems ATPase subunit
MEEPPMTARRSLIKLTTRASLATVLAVSAVATFAQKPVELLNVSYALFRHMRVFDNAASPFVYGFLDDVNLFHGRAHEGEMHIGAQQFNELAFKEGETLMLTPKRARVFVET